MISRLFVLTWNNIKLHRDLYKYSPIGIGGKCKNNDNVITEKMMMALNSLDSNPLLLIPLFILDFLCIHPFNAGNGRISRLLTLLLLYQNDYIVGKYISLEMLIEKTSKQDIIEKHPDISKIKIERTLSKLLTEGKILKIEAGKNTKYIKKPTIPIFNGCWFFT